MKICLTLIAIKKVQIARYHYITTTMAKIKKKSLPSAGEDLKQLELSHFAGRIKIVQPL